MDATKYLINEHAQMDKTQEEHFSFKWLAQQAINRQKQNKDTIIAVTGERRNGKSNWVLKLLKQYIALKNASDKDFKWSWKKNFPLTRQQAVEEIEDIQIGSFVDYDEAGDILYSADTLGLMNKKLIKFMAKSGSKKLLTVFTIPDIFMLDKKILNMCLFLVTVPYRYQDLCAFAFIYGRNPNPYIQDKFGLEYVKRLFASRKMSAKSRMPTLTGTSRMMVKGKYVDVPYPKELFKFLRSLPTFLHWHRFSKASDQWEASYNKFVKSKQLSMVDDFGFVKQNVYKRITEKYETLIYNLYYKQNLNYAQIERLHMNQNGTRLMGGASISKLIESLNVKFDTNKSKEIEEIISDNNG